MKNVRQLLKTYREPVLYLVFGVLTTVVSFLSAGIAKGLMEGMGWSTHAVSTVSTVISWVCAVTFAYLTNRRWVFASAVGGVDRWREAAAFYGGRVFTLLFETAFMWVGSSVLTCDYWWTKITANVVVLVLNYLISKLLVFRKTT